MNKLKNIILEGLALWKCDALIRTDIKRNKVEIFNQIRAVQGIVVLDVKHSDFLDSKATSHYEYSLISFKFIARNAPSDELKRIVEFSTKGPTKILGLVQFIPRLNTLVNLGKY